jgi:hypothetical protein
MNGKCEIHHNQIYFMVHSNVWKFEQIQLSGTLIIIQKQKVWRTDERMDERTWGSLYTPQTLVEQGIKSK